MGHSHDVVEFSHFASSLVFSCWMKSHEEIRTVLFSQEVTPDMTPLFEVIFLQAICDVAAAQEQNENETQRKSDINFLPFNLEQVSEHQTVQLLCLFDQREATNKTTIQPSMRRTTRESLLFCLHCSFESLVESTTVSGDV